MARECNEFKKIEARAEDLADWLESNAPECRYDQKHLDEGSQERVYWHYGYMVALRDVLRQLSGQEPLSVTDRSADTSNTIPPA